MKNLQNNYTTPKQSKRLLELGVPADSADCYYYDWAWIGGEFDGKSIQNCSEFGFRYERIMNNQIYPCWSVGRLIEIIMLCGISANHKIRPIFDSDLYEIHDTLIEYLVQELEDNDDWYDFSKLED